MTTLENKIKEELKKRKPHSYGFFMATNATRDIIIGVLWIISVALLGAVVYIMQNFPWKVLIRPNLMLTGLIGLPWEIIGACVILIVILYFLTKNISTLYRNKNILLVALVLSLFSGYFIAEASGLNDHIARNRAISPIYQQRGRFLIPTRFPETIGEIIETGENPRLRDILGIVWKIKFKPDARVQVLRIGQRVVIVGEKKDGTIFAQEIITLKGNRGFCVPRGSPNHCPLY